MIFLIDCDEVLADFSGAVLAVAESEFGKLPDTLYDDWDFFKAFTPGQNEVLSTVIEQPGFCASLAPCEGARRGVGALRGKGLEVVCVTTPWHSSTWAYERQNWLQEHFGISRSHTVFTEAKHLVQGDYLLDDRPSHVAKWSEHNPNSPAFLWGTRFNTRDTCLRRVEGWTMLKEWLLY